MKPQFPCLLWAAFSLASLNSVAPRAFGALLAYEGYDYAADAALAGQTGGSGFLAAWGTSPGQAMIRAPGITYPSLETVGNKLFVSGVGGTVAIFRDLVEARGTDGTTTWISLLGVRTGAKSGAFGPGGIASYVRPINFSLFQAGTEILALGEGTRTSGISLPDTDTWGLVVAGGVNNTATRWTTNTMEVEAFAVVRIDHGAGNVDTAYMWINPSLDSEPSTSTAGAVATGNFNFNRVRPFAGNPSTDSGNIAAEGYFDEFRVGESWSDVVPIVGTGPVGFLVQPADQTVDEKLPAHFSVSITGAPPRTIQWQRKDGAGDFADVPDATNAMFTIASTRFTDNGAMFRAIANNSFGSATSQVATLTIIADQIKPTLAKFSLCDSFSELLLIFSEAVTPATAGNTANYTFSGGGIDSATLQADERRVILRTTMPMAEGAAYTLAVQGIQDISTAANTLDTTNIAFTSSIVQTGYVRREIYTNTVTTSVEGVLNSAKLLARSPDLLGVANSVETPAGFADNYGERISGYLLPQQSGNYFFYLATDDHSHLYLSTDDEPANKVLIAQETSWADMRLWTGDRTSGTRGFPPSNISTNPVSLAAGSRYYFEIVHRDGTGGDHLGLTWRLDTDPEPANGSPSALTGLLIAAIASAADVTITQQPQSVTTNENRRVTLATAATASAAGLVISYQWQRDDGIGGFTNIPGAMASSYTTPLLVSVNDNNSQYRVVVAVAGDEAISQVATLTVNDDVEPPQVLSLVRLGGSKTQIRVEYDEPVDSTALDALNFIVENEFTGDVIPLLENQSIRIDERTVVLISSQPLSDSARYKLQFFGTSDLSGNTLTGEKRIAFLGPIVPSGAQNLAVFEAENYDGNLSQGGSSWEFHTATAGFSGSGAMDSTPNTGRGVNEPAHLTTAPRLDYRINFPVAGTYYVWVRGYGRNGNDDSGHVGLNNVSAVNYNWRLTGWGTTYSWQRTVTATPARIDVPSAGLHAFNFWMREDGTIVDKFILTTDSAFTPTGTGPAESARGTLPPVRQPISIARTGNSVTISWPVSANLEEADDVTGSWTVVATGATSHTVQASAAMKFYRVVEP